MYTLHTLNSIGALGYQNSLNPYSTEKIENSGGVTPTVTPTGSSYPNYPDLQSELEAHAYAQNQMIIRNSQKRIRKKGKEHDAIENWLGRHNRKFEILRTLTSIISATASSIVLLKLFGAI